MSFLPTLQSRVVVIYLRLTRNLVHSLPNWVKQNQSNELR